MKDENEFSPEESAEVEALFENYEELLAMQHVYNSAIKLITMRFEVINDEFRIKYARSPIHHIESRLKTTKSIVKKLKKRNYPISVESAKEHLNDIAGVRVVCGYINDVYSVADMLLRQSDIRLLEKKDYIKEPNYNGYRSLHLDVEFPLNLSDHTEYVPVEVQLRSVAMDLWASLEHDLRYKSDKTIPENIGIEMHDAADKIAMIDRQMQDIYEKIQKI